MRTPRRRSLLILSSMAAALSCAGDSTGDSATAPSDALVGHWQSAVGQLPSLQLTFTAENAAAGSGVLSVVPTLAVQGSPTPAYSGDSLTIVSGSTSGSGVTFAASLGRNSTGTGTFYVGTVSFTGTRDGTSLTATIDYTPPRTITQVFAAQSVARLVLTKAK